MHRKSFFLSLFVVSALKAHRLHHAVQIPDAAPPFAGPKPPLAAGRLVAMQLPR